MLTGETLAVALRRTTRDVLVLDNGRPTAKLAPIVALQLVETQLHWCGSGTKRRVSAIELRIPKPQTPEIPRGGWEECWRTVSASVMQPSIEWLHTRRVGYAEA
jgi:hypothetical protein